MKKKGMSQMWWIIGTALLTIIIVFLLLSWSKGTGEKAVGAIDKQIGFFGDWDQDGVTDKLDKCPDQGTKGEVDAVGCPKKKTT